MQVLMSSSKSLFQLNGDENGDLPPPQNNVIFHVLWDETSSPRPNCLAFCHCGTYLRLGGRLSSTVGLRGCKGSVWVTKWARLHWTGVGPGSRRVRETPEIIPGKAAGSRECEASESLAVARVSVWSMESHMYPRGHKRTRVKWIRTHVCVARSRTQKQATRSPNRIGRSLGGESRCAFSRAARNCSPESDMQRMSLLFA
jgi:hypothetical protein